MPPTRPRRRFRPDGDPDVSLGQGRRIIHAVTDHGDPLPAGLEPADRIGLVRRQHLAATSSIPIRRATESATACASPVIMAAIAGPAGGGADRLDRFRADLILDPNRAQNLTVPDDVEDRLAGAPHPASSPSIAGSAGTFRSAARRGPPT